MHLPRRDVLLRGLMVIGVLVLSWILLVATPMAQPLVRRKTSTTSKHNLAKQDLMILLSDATDINAKTTMQVQTRKPTTNYRVNHTSNSTKTKSQERNENNTATAASPTINMTFVSSITNDKLTLENLEALLDPLGIPTNTKLTPNGQIDWSYYTHLQLYHTRKAGGTSLMKWATLVAKKHNLTVQQQEGTCYDPRDWKALPKNQHALVFTSLRPPMDRVISSYEYDALQTSSDKVNNNLTLTEFVQHANEANLHGRHQRKIWRNGVMGGIAPQKPHGMTDKQWQRHQKRKRQRFHNGRVQYQVTRGWIWQCASNCYSKWFGGWPQPTEEADTVTALQRLDELEIIWMDALAHPEYHAWVLHRFDALDLPIQHYRQTADRVHQNYSHQEIRLLHDQNQADELLYQVLRQKWSRYTNLTLQ